MSAQAKRSARQFRHYKQVHTNLQVLQRVLALCTTRLLCEARAQSALNVFVVKQHLQVCISHECTWRFVGSARVRCLAFRGASDGTEDFVETLECRLSPDAESAEMSTWLETKIRFSLELTHRQTGRSSASHLCQVKNVELVEMARGESKWWRAHREQDAEGSDE